MDLGEIFEAASDFLEGAKDVVSDIIDNVGDMFSDAGEMAQEALDTMGEGVVEALKEGDFGEAIEQSDLPEEAKEALQETKTAFNLEFSKDGKDIARLGIGLAEALAGFGTGNVAIGILGGVQAAKAGVNLWQSASQVSSNSGNSQLQKMAQTA